MDNIGRVLCDACQQRSDDKARAVASFVSVVDEETNTHLEKALRGAVWDITKETNTPSCGCKRCSRYQEHLLSAVAGYKEKEDFLELQRLQQLKAKQAQNAKLPVIILDEDDPLAAVLRQQQTRPDSIPPTTLPEPDTILVHHMELLRQLQSARGRLVINEYLQQDCEAKARLKMLSATMTAVLTFKSIKCDEKLAQMTERQKDLKLCLDDLDRLQKDLEGLEVERKRKIPINSHNLSVSNNSDPNPILSLLQSGDFNTMSRENILAIRQELMSMPVPTHDQSPEVYARWLQVNKNSSQKGTPACAPDWIVDLRDVRGRNTIMKLVPPGPPRHKSRDDRTRHTAGLQAILQVLAIPGRYANLIETLDIRLAGNVVLSHEFHRSYHQPLDEEKVARELADQGLTVQMADDAWQYCFRLLTDFTSNPTSILPLDVATELLRRAKEGLEAVGYPEGINSKSQDQLRRIRQLDIEYQE
ncbi:hypothetical protein C8R43DRAFT_1126976 [Mycena crocata]|nr:hypothetical protein C8R43DRAFT_1126976 [Mycena crocata]